MPALLRLPSLAAAVFDGVRLLLLVLRPRRGGVGAHRAAAAAAASREDDLLSWCLFFARPPASPGSALLPPLLPMLELLQPESVVVVLLRPTLNVLDRGDADGLHRGWSSMQIPTTRKGRVCAWWGRDKRERCSLRVAD